MSVSFYYAVLVLSTIGPFELFNEAWRDEGGMEVDENAPGRSEEHSSEEVVIAQLIREHNLPPDKARAVYYHLQKYFSAGASEAVEVGVINFRAMSAADPPGRGMASYQRVIVRLTIDDSDDLKALNQGVGALRREKIRRMTREALEQGALLSQEELMRLICASRSTIKRDIAQLRAARVDIPTRGQVKDIGRGTSRKTQIVADWLSGSSIVEIQSQRGQDIKLIRRYCQDFCQVAYLFAQKIEEREIRKSTGLTERIVREYIALCESAGQNNPRLRLILEQSGNLPED